ncbi:MAG: hypothetical protein V1792_12435, partial [Pseudomonadota bacterium]
MEQARENLREALEMFFETPSDEEVKERLREDVRRAGGGSRWLSVLWRKYGHEFFAPRLLRRCAPRNDIPQFVIASPRLWEGVAISRG